MKSFAEINETIQIAKDVSQLKEQRQVAAEHGLRMCEELWNTTGCNNGPSSNDVLFMNPLRNTINEKAGELRQLLDDLKAQKEDVVKGKDTVATIYEQVTTDTRILIDPNAPDGSKAAASLRIEETKNVIAQFTPKEQLEWIKLLMSDIALPSNKSDL